MLVDATSAQALELAGEAIRAGKIICLPTDTVYGIGCDPFNPRAIDSLLTAKSRTRAFPPPVLVANFEQARSLGKIGQQAQKLMQEFWPGALTVVVQAADDVGWDLGETGGTVALRMPACNSTLQLLQVLGPLAVTSANLHSAPPAQTVEQAADQLGSSVAVYLDLGRCGGGISSTIVRVAGAGGSSDLEILRQGEITEAQLRAAVGAAP